MKLNLGYTIMGKTCLLAAICASARRSTLMRPVSAFTGSFVTSTKANHSSSSASFTRLAMSTDVTASPQILKRVKTAEASPSDGDVAIKGWVRTVRKQKTLAFVEVNDGSSLSGIQCVLPFDAIDENSKAEIDNLSTGCSVEVVGRIVESQGKQKFEVQSSSLRIVGECPADTYPLAKKTSFS